MIRFMIGPRDSDPREGLRTPPLSARFSSVLMVAQYFRETYPIVLPEHLRLCRASTITP